MCLVGGPVTAIVMAIVFFIISGITYIITPHVTVKVRRGYGVYLMFCNTGVRGQTSNVTHLNS